MKIVEGQAMLNICTHTRQESDSMFREVGRVCIRYVMHTFTVRQRPSGRQPVRGINIESFGVKIVRIAYLVDIVVVLLKRRKSLITPVTHAGQLLKNRVVMFGSRADSTAKGRHLGRQVLRLGNIFIVKGVKDGLAKVC